MIRAIAAVDRELGIGNGGKIPWKLPADEHYFTEMTQKFGGNVLTGWRTFNLTYHGPLKGRTNYILTHENRDIPGTVVVRDLDTFLAGFKEDLWIAGGEAVFTAAFDRIDELYLTHIDGTFGCDRFFPSFQDKFELAERKQPLTENGLVFYYAIYRRK